MGELTDNKSGSDTPSLYEAAKAYVRAAIELAHERSPEKSAPISGGPSNWVRESETVFRMRETEIPYWFLCLARCRNEMMALSEYGPLVAALRSDAAIAPLLETLVGSPWSAMRIEADSIIQHLVWQTTEASGELGFDASAFEEVFRRLVADLHRPELDYVFVTPLFGLMAESLPMRLMPPSVEIDRLTDSEIARCLRIGVLPSPISAIGAGIALVGSGAGVRICFKVRRRIDEVSKDESDRATNEIERLRLQTEAVIYALRLFKEGQVPIVGSVLFTEQWPSASGTQSMGTFGGPSICNYELKADETVEFRRFWDDLQKCSAKAQFVEAAMRRFGYAGERHRPEDQLVDLLIAAESLFLTDAGGATDRGELRYRLSIRSAFFIEESGYSRHELFDHMRHAYNVRSAIVHGGRPEARDLVLPKRDRVELPKFVEETRRLLRLSLKKAIRMAAAGDPAFGQWEQPILD